MQMKHATGRGVVRLLVLTLVVAAWLTPSRARAIDSARVKKLFQHPSREYSTGPLWVWNDMLTDEEVRSTLRDLAAQQVKQAWVHPRPGLMTPYLSDRWFQLWQVALDEARRLDMNVWIYDENSYPSGFAGGWVPELMPESRGQGLNFSEAAQPPKWNNETLAVFRITDGHAENVSQHLRAGEELGNGRYLVATVVRAPDSPWTGGRAYVNLLTPGVTEKFLDITLEAYRKHVGGEFGKRIPGVFTDEPNIHPTGEFPWCDDLPEQFQRRWGSSLLDDLASLKTAVGDWRKVRFQYFSTLNDLFLERWSKPYHDYCEQHHLEWTGHYWDHEWPNCGTVPDNMAMYAWHQRPGIDCLMNQYAENTHAQFGNARMVKELTSVANQLGQKRTLCETYGAGGWDLRFEDMKRIGDWLSVLGVNTINQHLDYITLRGARKRDHPQSFSYHEPWWDAYHIQAGYFARLSAALSQGEQINRILVIEPTTTAWMYQGDAKRLQEVGDSFFQLVMSLEAAQIEYDLGSESILADHGSVRGKQFQVGRRAYDVVVIPPATENLNARTWELLFRYVLGGGQVLSCAQSVRRSDGQTDAPPIGLTVTSKHWQRVATSDLPARLQRLQLESAVTQVERSPDDRGVLFHQRRRLDDGELLFLVNTSNEHPSRGTVASALGGVEQWDLLTGRTRPYPFARAGRKLSADFTLPPSGSLLLFLSKKPNPPARVPAESTAVLDATGPVETRRLEPNVLTLDYVDVTAGGETKSNTYFYAAQQFVFQKNGLPRNPWDSAVQFKDDIISKTFAADSGFTASYKFTIEGGVPSNLAIVIERPDLYTITCNGWLVSNPAGDWWLDKSFGRIAIADTARAGENVVTLKASPFTIFHELESAYVLGDFTLKATERGFIITPDQPLRLAPTTTTTARTHSINSDGTMWLSGGIGFGQPTDDRAPFVVFDLGSQRDLGTVRVWNYCEAQVRDLTSRGAKEIRLTGAADAAEPTFNQPLGQFTLRRGNPGGGASEDLPVPARGVRFVRLDILSKQDGVTFPATGQPEDNGFVGLAEVQFLAPDGRKLDGVKVRRASSELPSHQRLARYLVDGSGLTASVAGGWNSQGHPFYSAGVAYREQFNVPKRNGRFVVALPKWLGSVARVSVNGKPAGYIDAPPWECEVTKHIRRGNNEIEVTVIGTLKNTLGPHHGNPGLGSAWPGMFQRGPNPGPPPGDQYATVGYGLFEPFVLRQIY